MTEAEFNQWVSSARPGSAVVYATHHTLGDKGVEDETLRVALRAKQAFADGMIELVQRRTEKYGPFDYMALKKAPGSTAYGVWRSLAGEASRQARNLLQLIISCPTAQFESSEPPKPARAAVSSVHKQRARLTKSGLCVYTLLQGALMKRRPSDARRAVAPPSLTIAGCCL